MSMIKKILLFFAFIFISNNHIVFAEDLKKIGKFKDWETMVLAESTGKVCFAQSAPVLQAPKKIKGMQGYL